MELLIELASLQTAFLTLDEAIKTTNRRVNALEHVVKPKLENTIAYIKVRSRGKGEAGGSGKRCEARGARGARFARAPFAGYRPAVSRPRERVRALGPSRAFAGPWPSGCRRLGLSRVCVSDRGPFFPLFVTSG